MEFAELIKTSRVENVVLAGAGLPPTRGTLCITSHHLLLSSRPGGDAAAVELWLLIRNVDAVEKRVQNLGWHQPPRSSSSPRDPRLSGSSGTITLRCKDLRVLHLDIPGMEECLNVASSIEALSSVDSPIMMYPFFYRPQDLRLEDGWQLFPLERFFQRVAAQTDQWRLSSVNEDFSTCPTYPPALIVPAAVDDGALRKAARFRHGGRFPVLSYYHGRTGTVMLRSSQPLTGPNRRRCREDELLLAAALAGVARGFVLDTRSAQAAKQARMGGGGTEPKASYPRWKRLHRPLERGRAPQESFARLVEACGDASLSMDRWLSRLESSRWLSHVKAALSTACLAAQCLEREEACVLVHGAEGTDTTLLVTALAQLILDPGCRTLTGFQELLEREWIQAGHPFHVRCARSAFSHARPKQEAPLFLLFLDCVWQLGRQFPRSLEFGERLLLALFDSAYASPYGTFLGNSERERRVGTGARAEPRPGGSGLRAAAARRRLCGVRQSTHCLWARLDQPAERAALRNPLYAPNALALWPCVEPQSILLWQGLFLRWIRPAQHLDEAWAEMRRLEGPCGMRPEEPGTPAEGGLHRGRADRALQ
ncbi:myotubularin-related protein 9-like [Eudromia elegans]